MKKIMMNQVLLIIFEHFEKKKTSHRKRLQID